VLFTTGYIRSPIVHHARLDADEHKIGEPNLLTDRESEGARTIGLDS